jgi:hypothetical protein
MSLRLSQRFLEDDLYGSPVMAKPPIDFPHPSTYASFCILPYFLFYHTLPDKRRQVLSQFICGCRVIVVI